MIFAAAVFGRFKVLYALANQKTIPEAIKAARKIAKNMQGVGEKLVKNLDGIYREIIALNGAGSPLMVD